MKHQISSEVGQPLLLDQLDLHFAEEIAKKLGMEDMKSCYTCNACTSVCPVREVIEDFDPRKIIHMIIMGMRDEVLASDLIWFCCSCNSCYYACPRRIRFSRIASVLQDMATTCGYVDRSFLARLAPVKDVLQELCRRTMFLKVRDGFRGSHTMPCWKKNKDGSVPEE